MVPFPTHAGIQATLTCFQIFEQSCTKTFTSNHKKQVGSCDFTFQVKDAKEKKVQQRQTVIYRQNPQCVLKFSQFNSYNKHTLPVARKSFN